MKPRIEPISLENTHAQLVASALNALRVERDDGLDATSIPFP